MSAPAFTSGPWLRETNLVYALDADGTVNRFSAAVSGGFTNYRDRAHTTLDEQEANARLISAAPDMYQTLECAKLAIERLDIGALGWGQEPHEMLGTNVVPVSEELLALIDAALAKARGEQ